MEEVEEEGASGGRVIVTAGSQAVTSHFISSWVSARRRYARPAGFASR